MRLTKREHEVLSLVAGGMTNEQAADSLQLHIGTVKNHMTAIMQKLDANDRTHAVVIALRRGWIHLNIKAYPELPVRFYDLSLKVPISGRTPLLRELPG